MKNTARSIVSMLSILSVAFTSVLAAQDSQTCKMKFVEVKAAQSGIAFVHNHGGSDQGFLVEGVSAGLATFDYDNDGFIDILFLNGTPLKGTALDRPFRSSLYRNNGDWTFKDVTEEVGLGETGYGLGVGIADYDADGDQDIYFNNFGANKLFRNNGDRTFSDVTDAAGVGNGNKVGAGVAFLDIDRDGDLDIYVANYVDFSYETHVPVIIKGRHYRAGPQYYKSVPDTLFRNEGKGVFTDVSVESGIGKVAGASMGIIAADFDNDNDTDVYVCNDGQRNFLFQNDGAGHFEEVAFLQGAAVDFEGKANSSMGIDLGDYNRDGWLDLFTTNYQSEMPVLYRNLGGGMFDDATNAAGITYDLFPHVNWGCSFSDFDNDGDQDLYIACGHFDRIEHIDDRTAEKVRNFLLMNNGGRFVDVTSKCGDGLAVIESSRGAAFEDLDNDGDIDIVILNSMAPPTLLRNDSQTTNHWLELEIKQPGMNIEAVGARIAVTTTHGVQTDEAVRGRGYQSHYGTRIHFGLGETQGKAKVQVKWPDGESQLFTLEVDKLHRLNR